MRKWWWLYPLVLAIYSIYSYAQVDPNLVFSYEPWWWRFQENMWQLGYHNRLWSSIIFGVLVCLLYWLYGKILTELRDHDGDMRLLGKLIGTSVVALLLAYPALSHDIFNYAMNAKMVWKYHVDPHVVVAMDFPEDPWLKFMNNIHTPAPYARGWTLLSIIPGFLGQNSIKLNLFWFKAMMIGFYGGMLYLLTKFVPSRKAYRIGLFALNPLVLIETVGNVHNDVVMMFLELAAILLATVAWKQKSWGKGILAGLLFLASVSIKYASLMVIPGLIGYTLLTKLGKRWSWGGIQTGAHALPLLTTRSQQYLPWYLIWAFAFVPMTKEKLVRDLVLTASLAALLAYLPYLYYGAYSPWQQEERKLITFGIPLLMVGYYFVSKQLAVRHHDTQKA